MKLLKDELSIKLIVMGVIINFGLAAIVSVFKLPIYLDAIGTILVTLMLGYRAGILVGFIGFSLMTITGVGPFHIYFVGTQAVIALVTHFLAKGRMFSSFFRVIVSGVLIGIVAAIVSAPVIVYLFGGVEGNGAGLITAFLIKTGKTILESVVLKGLSIEPIDKTLQCLLVYRTLKAVNTKRLKAINSKLIQKNFLDEK